MDNYYEMLWFEVINVDGPILPDSAGDDVYDNDEIVYCTSTK